MNATDAHSRLEFLLEAREVLDAQIDEAKAALGLRRRRRSRREIPECPSEAGYQYHRHRLRSHGEPFPDDCGCRAAHAEHNRKAS